MPRDVFDIDVAPVQDEYEFERYSGHKLFCPKCNKFKRAAITLEDKFEPVLRVTCKACGYAEDFVSTDLSGLLPKWYRDITRKFTMRRAREVLRGRRR